MTCSHSPTRRNADDTDYNRLGPLNVKSSAHNSSDGNDPDDAKSEDPFAVVILQLFELDPVGFRRLR